MGDVDLFPCEIWIQIFRVICKVGVSFTPALLPSSSITLLHCIGEEKRMTGRNRRDRKRRGGGRRDREERRNHFSFNIIQSHITMLWTDVRHTCRQFRDIVEEIATRECIPKFTEILIDGGMGTSLLLSSLSLLLLLSIPSSLFALLLCFFFRVCLSYSRDVLWWRYGQNVGRRKLYIW